MLLSKETERLKKKCVQSCVIEWKTYIFKKVHFINAGEHFAYLKDKIISLLDISHSCLFCLLKKRKETSEKKSSLSG